MSIEDLLQAHYVSRAVFMTAVVRHFKPRGYITSISSMGSEHPVVAYLNARGVATILYCYSANVSLFSPQECDCDFRNVDLAHIVARHVVVWHAEMQGFLASHPQDGARIHVMGPLMAGDERVMHVDRRELLERYRLRLFGDPLLKWVCAFDEALPAKSFQRGRAVFPLPYTVEYGTAFLRDLLRLLEEDRHIVLVFKPQRNLMKSKFVFSDEFRRFVARIQQHPRGLVLPDNVNPWLPIALADCCIGMPFTSPIQAGWHYDVPGIYHDPMRLCHRHRYPERLITHSYEELKAKVQALLCGVSASASTGDGYLKEIEDFVGPREPETSSDRFRRLLCRLSGAAGEADTASDPAMALTGAPS